MGEQFVPCVAVLSSSFYPVTVWWVIVEPLVCRESRLSRRRTVHFDHNSSVLVLGYIQYCPGLLKAKIGLTPICRFQSTLESNKKCPSSLFKVMGVYNAGQRRLVLTFVVPANSFSDGMHTRQLPDDASRFVSRPSQHGPLVCCLCCPRVKR